jgi:hypothetical protein
VTERIGQLALALLYPARMVAHMGARGPEPGGRAAAIYISAASANRSQGQGSALP